jgi:hypothetical protein
MMKKMFFSFVLLILLGSGTASCVYAYEGYEQGRQWGREHGITDTEYRSEDTSAFAEGVRQSARENLQQREQAE